MSAVNPEPNANSGVPLTRRQLRELEMAEAEMASESHVIVEEDVVAPSPVPAPVNDSGLPSLFGDDEKEEVKEEPVVAASYAREAPAAKYLDKAPVRRVIPPAPAAPRSHTAPVVRAGSAKQESWTTGAVIKVVSLSVLYFGLIIAAMTVPILMVAAEAGSVAP